MNSVVYRFIICLSFALGINPIGMKSVANELPEAVFVSDELASGAKPVGATLVIDKLKQRLSDKLKFVYIKASRKREWRELTTHDNVCLFNKIKTSEREETAYFSAIPIQVFPPNQLIVLDNKKLPQAITIQEAIHHYKLNIAVQSGRSYGEETDIQLRENKKSLSAIEGLNSTGRVMKMMLNGRFNAIVEYSTVVETNLKEQGDESLLSRISAHQILGGAGFSHGFIACSKTPEGLHIIKVINSVLKQEDMQNMMVDLNLSYFPEISHPSIKNEWIHLTSSYRQ